jgi:dimethylamine/trimethylamine dehydrogenase
MTGNSRYEVLFEPVRIGPVTAQNRFYQVCPLKTTTRRFE